MGFLTLIILVTGYETVKIVEGGLLSSLKVTMTTEVDLAAVLMCAPVPEVQTEATFQETSQPVATVYRILQEIKELEVRIFIFLQI